MFDSKKLGCRLHHIRTTRQLTREDVAKRANITVAYLGNLEIGDRTPTLETFIDLANALNVDANYLLLDALDVLAPTAGVNDEGARMFFLQPQAEIQY